MGLAPEHSSEAVVHPQYCDVHGRPISSDDRKEIADKLRFLVPGHTVARIWGRMEGHLVDEETASDNIWAADPEDLADIFLTWMHVRDAERDDRLIKLGYDRGFEDGHKQGGPMKDVNYDDE